MLVKQFAESCASYLGGTEYGQSGNIPTSVDLPACLASGIGRAVAYGHNAAVAMNEGNAALANDTRGHFEAQHRAVFSHLGLTYGQWDMCYQIGYNAARKETVS